MKEKRETFQILAVDTNWSFYLRVEIWMAGYIFQEDKEEKLQHQYGPLHIGKVVIS